MIKNDLKNCIQLAVQDKARMTFQPDRFFTRNRKLSLESLVWSILSLSASDLKSSLAKWNEAAGNDITSSAFSQQRAKLLPDAMKSVFDRFAYACYQRSGQFTFKGMRLLAVDGSDFQVVTNARDSSSYFLSQPTFTGYNLIHVNAILDIGNNIFVDMNVLPRREDNERTAAIEMATRCSDPKNPAIYLFDRGYESYAVPVCLNSLKQYFIIRAQGPDGSCIVSGLTKMLGRRAKSKRPFDITFTKVLKRQEDGSYKPVETLSPDNTILTLRLVRVKLSKDTVEYLLTNLPPDAVSVQELKELYRLRWGIETSFRHVKYDLDGKALHARDFKNYVHEIYATFILYNFCSSIIMHTNQKYMAFLRKKKRKYAYRINFRQGIRICRHYLLRSFLDIERQLLQHLVAIQRNRKTPLRKKVRFKGAIAFGYRPLAI